MATPLPVLSNIDLYRAKNKKAADEVIPFVYETVIAWGCGKEEHESFIDYYNRREEKVWNDNKEKWEEEVDKKLETHTKGWPEENKWKEKERRLNKFKKEKLKEFLIKEAWTKDEQKKLAQENCEGFDVTLLHKLVPTICDGIGRYDPNAPSSTEIEKFLREIKNIRNNISHDPKGASVSNTILGELKVSAENVFEAAEILYASTLDKQPVLDKINELKERLRRIEDEVTTNEQLRILQTAKKMSEDGMVEMKETVRQLATDYLPHSGGKFTRTKIYHDVSVSMSVENENEDAGLPEDQKTVEIPSTEILQNNGRYNILCEGEPGSGKTTLLRRLQEDFFATGKKMFPGLNMFDLLLYMDCRDKTLENISQLLRRTFPKTMNQLNDQEALQALHETKILICVDGLDELNKKSRKLLDELISTFQWHGDATFVCTSRPGQSDYLRSVKYKTMSLQPITQEKDQILFLERYQANIEGIVAPELLRAFKSLVQSCKDCLRQPIYLALFCYLFRKFGQKVCLWKNELNIMEHILTLSEQTMIDRMKTMNLENREHYADNVTKAITQLSVQLVYQGEVTIDKDTYTDLSRKIFGRALAKVPHYSIMSSYFTKHADGQSFNFYHKSYLEFLAAKQLYKSLVSNPSASIISEMMSLEQSLSNLSDDIAPATDAASGPDVTDGEGVGGTDVAPAPDVATAPNVTDGKDVSLGRFENVFYFISMMLVEGGPKKERALKSFLEEVCPAFVKEQVGLWYWVKLTLSCPSSDIVAEAAALAAKTVVEKETSPNQRKWQITTLRDMSAVSRMLRYHQPAWLDIKPLWFEGLPAELKPLLETVAKRHTGQLDLSLEESFFSFSGIDDLVICLESARCTLRNFFACIGPSREAGQVLDAAATKAVIAEVEPQLNVALTHPRQHQLYGLDGTRHGLWVLAQLNPSEVSKRCPLPRSSLRPPRLSVSCRLVTGEAVTEIASLIEDLAPTDGQYYSFTLQQWKGTDPELQELLQRLSASGVSTRATGPRRWLPRIERSDGCCIECQNIHQKDWGRCVELQVPEPHPRDDVEETKVLTVDEMSEVISSLPHTPLPWLVVSTRKSEAPPPTLGPLVGAVAKWHQGNLDLDFNHSFRHFVAVDDLLTLLQPARCPLVTFRGCLSGSTKSAWRALVDGVMRAERAGIKQDLAISLLEPRQHELGELDGTRQSLEIRVRQPSSPGDRSRCPLPTKGSLKPPGLTVEFESSAGNNASDVEETTTGLTAALIEDLAPEDKRYRNVYLQHYPGTNDALNGMVARLSERGVRTSGGKPSWIEAGINNKGNCKTCKESGHPLGGRCVRLYLA